MPYLDKEKHNECNRKYYADNIEKIKKSRKRRKDKITESRRRTTLETTSGKFSGLTKRPYPLNQCCELCNRKTSHLVYHHWDDLNLSMGIWICNYCHCFCERCDSGFYKKYIKMKDDVFAQMPAHLEKYKKLLKKDAIIKLLKKGKSNIEIVRTLGVNKDYVCHIRSLNNIPVQLKWTQKKIEYLISNYGKEKTKEIAIKLGVTVDAIYSKINKIRNRDI